MRGAQPHLRSSGARGARARRCLGAPLARHRRLRCHCGAGRGPAVHAREWGCGGGPSTGQFGRGHLVKGAHHHAQHAEHAPGQQSRLDGTCHFLPEPRGSPSIYRRVSRQCKPPLLQNLQLDQTALSDTSEEEPKACSNPHLACRSAVCFSRRAFTGRWGHPRAAAPLGHPRARACSRPPAARARWRATVASSRPTRCRQPRRSCSW
jgi:hypothetical protein